jgi:hypothetical protein
MRRICFCLFVGWPNIFPLSKLRQNPPFRPSHERLHFCFWPFSRPPQLRTPHCIIKWTMNSKESSVPKSLSKGARALISCKGCWYTLHGKKFPLTYRNVRPKLILTSRYPIHANPRNNQSFMYLNLAISLTSDLGLDREAPNLNGFSKISTEGLIDGASFTDAARRAYLGCYYLSCASVFLPRTAITSS